jgi:hypothetical protein
VEDYLAILHADDERISRIRQERAVREKTEKDAAQELMDAWQAVFSSLETAEHDDSGELLPDFAPFLALARVVKLRGYDHWWSEMAQNFVRVLDDDGMDRRAQLFFVNLMLNASKSRVTAKQLATAYRAYAPTYKRPFWRTAGARDVFDFFYQRVHKETKEAAQRKAQAAAIAAEKRLQTLKEAARRRPAIAKQLFAVYWSERELRPAAIRDKWNRLYPQEHVGDGEIGRNDIKTAIRRGKQFLQDNETTASEMVPLLSLKLE